jgi:methylmalonyl-CoA mutase
VIEQLTDLVEDAVLRELERISDRGGVLGAMEALYQRSKIQEESLHYEALKHSGELPLIGVNTFENPDAEAASQRPATIARSSDDERRAQLGSLRAFHARWADESGPALARLADAARRGDNVFAELMNAVRYASLGQITECLFAVGGAYRRAM